MHDHRPVTDLATTQHGVISREQAGQLGLPKWMLGRWARAGRLRSSGERTFVVPGSPATWEQQLTIGLLELGTGALVAGRSAAALHHFDGFLPGPVELLVDRSVKRLPAGYVIRSTSLLRPIDRCEVGGFAATSALRTILDLAALVSFTELAAAIDGAVRDRLVTERFLRRQLQLVRGPGRAGVRRLDAALVDAGGHSWLERRFLRLVRSARLPRPTCQHVHDDRGRFVARSDFCWMTERVVVEVAGYRFHRTRAQHQRDAQRHTELQLQGFIVLTFTYDDVVDRPGWVVDQVRAALGNA